jgi:hypothetical protein
MQIQWKDIRENVTLLFLFLNLLRVQRAVQITAKYEQPIQECTLEMKIQNSRDYLSRTYLIKSTVGISLGVARARQRQGKDLELVDEAVVGRGYIALHGVSPQRDMV